MPLTSHQQPHYNHNLKASHPKKCFWEGSHVELSKKTRFKASCDQDFQEVRFGGSLLPSLDIWWRELGLPKAFTPKIQLVSNIQLGLNLAPPHTPLDCSFSSRGSYITLKVNEKCRQPNFSLLHGPFTDSYSKLRSFQRKWQFLPSVRDFPSPLLLLRLQSSLTMQYLSEDCQFYCAKER